MIVPSGTVLKENTMREYISSLMNTSPLLDIDKLSYNKCLVVCESKKSGKIYGFTTKMVPYTNVKRWVSDLGNKDAGLKICYLISLTDEEYFSLDSLPKIYSFVLSDEVIGHGIKIGDKCRVVKGFHKGLTGIATLVGDKVRLLSGKEEVMIGAHNLEVY